MNLPPAFPPDSNYDAPAPAPAPENQAKGASKIRLQKFLTALRKFWWVPLVTLVFCVVTTAIKFYYTPPTFVSYAKMWETEKLRLPDGAAFTEDPETYFGTLSEVLRSDHMKQNALQLMHLSETNIPTADKNGNTFDVQINLYQQPKSSVFTIEADSSNPAFTPAYLNALMSAYKEYKRTVRKEVSGDTLASIAEQVQKLERDLKTDQDALAAFEQSNNYTVLQQENDIAGGYLAKLKTQLADYQLQTRLLDAVALEKDSNLSGLTNSAANLFEAVRDSGDTTSPVSESQDAYKDIQLLKLQRDRLSKYLRPKHPKIVKLDEDIARSQKLIDLYHQQNQQQIATARQALQIRMDGVNQSIAEWEAKVAYANSRIAEVDRLKVNVARNEALYERLVALLQNVDISRNIDQETLTVLESASEATRSYKEIKSSLIKSALGGAVFGLALVFLVSLRDDRIISLVEVTEKITDNVVGQVPEVRQLRGGPPLGVLQKNDDRHMYVESYRSLRSALLYITTETDRPKVILVTSSVPNEGKSTIATNLARILALGGARVLLVDGDLRRGHLHDLLGMQSKPGLTELLQQPGDLSRFIQTNSLPNLSFIARGKNMHNSGDLLLSAVFEQFLAQVREQFDYVIIDCSPIFATDDATTIAPKVDGTLFVVRSHFSRTGMVKEALELLSRRRARVLGLIFNRANASDQSYHYYKDADYYSTAVPEEDEAG